MKYHGIELVEGSDVRNLTVPSGGSFPANPNAGELFYRSDLNLLYIYTDSWGLITGSTVTGGANTIITTTGCHNYKLVFCTKPKTNRANRLNLIHLYSSNWTLSSSFNYRLRWNICRPNNYLARKCNLVRIHMDWSNE